MKEKTLTKGEMLVMNVLWSIGRGASVNDILEQYDEPRPAYTTIATFLKILMQKGFVEAKKGTGKQLVYNPLMTKERYRDQVMDDVKESLFDGSAKSLLNHFVQEEDLSVDEIEELIDLIKQKTIS